MKKISIILTAMLLAVLLVGCGCQHEWIDATCDTPKTCTKCSATEGEALGHNWVEATCTESEHCSICGKLRGQSLGHDWSDATCTSGKKCKLCGILGGEALGHTPGEWESSELDPVAAREVFTRKCSVCGEVLEEEERVAEFLHNNKQFFFTPAEFVQRITNQTANNNLPYIVAATDPKRSEDAFECLLIKDGVPVASIYFFDATDRLLSKQQNDAVVSNILVNALTNDNTDLSCIFKLTLVTCDPLFTSAEDLNNGLIHILEAANLNSICEISGVRYRISQVEEEWMAMLVSLRGAG